MGSQPGSPFQLFLLASPQPKATRVGTFPSTPLGACGWRQVPGSHLVEGERVQCAVLHCDVVHLVGLQGNPSQGPAGLLAAGSGQTALEMGILALAELHIPQGLQDGHIRGCTREGIASALASGMPPSPGVHPLHPNSILADRHTGRTPLNPDISGHPELPVHRATSPPVPHPKSRDPCNLSLSPNSAWMFQL